MRLCYILFLMFLAASTAFAGAIWCDGTRTDEAEAPGKLLTDNPGYWGPSILTGVDYTYVTAPASPSDQYYNDPNTFGNRLLDGRASADWAVPGSVPVGIDGNVPLVVTFDFKRPCVFAEVDVVVLPKCSRTDIAIELADEPNGPYKQVFARKKKDCPDKWLHRIPLVERPAGRYLRITQSGNSTNCMAEIYVWGDGEVSLKYPEDDAPLHSYTAPKTGCYQAYPGMDETTFSAEQFRNWLSLLKGAKKKKVIWAPYKGAKESMFPARQVVNKPIKVLMARNEYEDVFMTVTNTSLDANRNIKIDLSSFQKDGNSGCGLEATLRVAGVIKTAKRGILPRPLFSADNILPKGLMKRYIINGGDIADFPDVNLPPGGSAVIGVSLATNNAKPGLYKAKLSATPGSVVELEIEVLNVNLPTPRAWVNTWSRITSMSPFTTDLRNQREIAYKRDELGITVWYDLPEPGNVSEMGYEVGRSYFNVIGVPLDEDQDIEGWIRNTLAKVKKLGLSYDQWYIELWDEPTPPTFDKFKRIAQRIKTVDPKINIYADPLFWRPEGWVPDAEAEAILRANNDWYNRLVDVSIPQKGSESPIDNPLSFAVFDESRLVRGIYAHPGPNRIFPWLVFERSWNGWGNYSYHSPRANSWNDFDYEPWRIGSVERPDYQYVYPGPTGPVPTFQSITFREGWEDYRLLTLLRNKGKNQTTKILLNDLKKGIEFDKLRIKALKAATPIRFGLCADVHKDIMHDAD